MATITIPNFLTEKVVNGLNTYQYTVTTAAMHTCRIKVDKLPGSTMTITINQNGSPIATTTLVAVLPYDGQSSAILQACANCAVNDTLSFVLNSSAVDDKQLNTVKATLNIHVGGLN